MTPKRPKSQKSRISGQFNRGFSPQTQKGAENGGKQPKTKKGPKPTQKRAKKGPKTGNSGFSLGILRKIKKGSKIGEKRCKNFQTGNLIEDSNGSPIFWPILAKKQEIQHFGTFNRGFSPGGHFLTEFGPKPEKTTFWHFFEFFHQKPQIPQNRKKSGFWAKTGFRVKNTPNSRKTRKQAASPEKTRRGRSGSKNKDLLPVYPHLVIKPPIRGGEREEGIYFGFLGSGAEKAGFGPKSQKSRILGQNGEKTRIWAKVKSRFNFRGKVEKGLKPAQNSLKFNENAKNGFPPLGILD